MRVLGIHSDGFAYEAHDRAMASAERITKREAAVEGDVLVFFIAVEEGDEKDPARLVKILAADAAKRARDLKVSTLVLYPYVHLTSSPSDPKTAMKILRESELVLKAVRTEAGVYSPDHSESGWPLQLILKDLYQPKGERWTVNSGSPASSRTAFRASSDSRSIFMAVLGSEGEDVRCTYG